MFEYLFIFKKMEIEISQLELFKLTIKKYVNLKKILFHIDKTLSEEFHKKQLYFYEQSQKNHSHCHSSHQNDSCCGESILFNNIYIPYDKMNNIEKNLYELYEKFYYDDEILKLVTYLNDKYTSITIKAKRDGMTLAIDDEKDFLHNLLKEGVNFYICSKLKNKLREYEESISSQPMLLANPGSLDKEKREIFLDKIPKDSLNQLINKEFIKIDENIYNNINPYEIYDEIKYLYLEGKFETIEITQYKCFTLKYNKNFFSQSKFNNLNQLSKVITYLPYELNMKFQEFSLQVSDYINIFLFKSNESLFDYTIDSSLNKNYDSGKKLTVGFVLFPNDVMLSKRKVTIQFKLINNSTGSLYDEVNEVEFTQPMSMFILKSRMVGYKIKEVCIDFSIIFYYLHGPIDKERGY